MDIKQLMIEMDPKKGGKLSNFIRYDSFKYFFIEFKLETRQEHQVCSHNRVIVK